MTLLLERPPAPNPSAMVNDTTDDGRTADAAVGANADAVVDITDYYRQTIDDYQTWSREGYMHFGLWRKGISPLNRKRMLEAMNDLVFNALQLPGAEPMKIADLGCGVGAVSRYGSRKYSQHRWFPVTLSPEQLQFGKTQLDPLDEERIDFVCADYCDLPITIFENHSLDAVFFLESLCHADHPSDALAEVSRVLKPGGRLVVVDGMMLNRPDATPAYANWISRKTAESWAVGQFHSVPQFESAVAECGLEIEERHEIGWQLAPCVAHSPLLIGGHALKLLATGEFTAWKRRHLIGCTLGVLLGMLRKHFGYFVYTITKPVLK